MRSIQKVTAFVTRLIEGKAEILLIEHPMAGRQLPAGTVELNESVEAAVIRETAEETGLERVQIVSKLGQIALELPDNERIITRVTKLFDSPASDASSVGGFGLTRGSPVKVQRLHGSFAEVISDPLDLSQIPPKRVNAVQGFVRMSLLAGKIERHLFHLTAVQATPNQWQSYSDGVAFRLFWEPLTPIPSIHPGQQAWLDQVYHSLSASIEETAGG